MRNTFDLISALEENPHGTILFRHNGKMFDVALMYSEHSSGYIQVQEIGVSSTEYELGNIEESYYGAYMCLREYMTDQELIAALETYYCCDVMCQACYPDLEDEIEIDESTGYQISTEEN